MQDPELETIDIEAVEVRRLALILMMTDNAGNLIFDELSAADRALFQDGGKVTPFHPTDDQIDKYSANGIYLPRNALMAACRVDKSFDESYTFPFVVHPWYCPPPTQHEPGVVSATRQMQFFGGAVFTDRNNLQQIIFDGTKGHEDLIYTTSKIFSLLSGPRNLVQSIARDYGLTNGASFADSTAIPDVKAMILMHMPDQRIARRVAHSATVMMPSGDRILPWMEP